MNKSPAKIWHGVILGVESSHANIYIVTINWRIWKIGRDLSYLLVEPLTFLSPLMQPTIWGNNA